MDGTFPNHEANPLIEENRRDIVERVIGDKADIGIAWDGDADRCFFIDGTGEFIAGDFVTALLAEAFLLKHPGAKIVYDVRASYAVKDIVAKYGGSALMNRVGHAFFKRRMREEGAIFGGEVTGHYYFRDNFYADNGFIPALLILELMSRKGQTLQELLAPLREKYFISGEINTRVPDHRASRRRSTGWRASIQTRRPTRWTASRPSSRLALQRARVEHRADASPEPRGDDAEQMERNATRCWRSSVADSSQLPRNLPRSVAACFRSAARPGPHPARDCQNRLRGVFDLQRGVLDVKASLEQVLERPAYRVAIDTLRNENVRRQDGHAGRDFPQVQIVNFGDGFGSRHRVTDLVGCQLDRCTLQQHAHGLSLKDPSRSNHQHCHEQRRDGVGLVEARRENDDTGNEGADEGIEVGENMLKAAFNIEALPIGFRQHPYRGKIDDDAKRGDDRDDSAGDLRRMDQPRNRFVGDER